MTSRWARNDRLEAVLRKAAQTWTRDVRTHGNVDKAVERALIAFACPYTDKYESPIAYAKAKKRIATLTKKAELFAKELDALPAPIRDLIGLEIVFELAEELQAFAHVARERLCGPRAATGSAWSDAQLQDMPGIRARKSRPQDFAAIHVAEDAVKFYENVTGANAGKARTGTFGVAALLRKINPILGIRAKSAKAQFEAALKAREKYDGRLPTKKQPHANQS